MGDKLADCVMKNMQKRVLCVNRKEGKKKNGGVYTTQYCRKFPASFSLPSIPLQHLSSPFPRGRPGIPSPRDDLMQPSRRQSPSSLLIHLHPAHHPAEKFGRSSTTGIFDDAQEFPIPPGDHLLIAVVGCAAAQL